MFTLEENIARANTAPTPHPSIALASTRPHSRWGLASFIWALLVGGGGFALVMASGVVGIVDPTLEATSPIYGALGLAMCATFPAGLLGLALSVVGLVEPGRRKVFAVLGFAFNLLVLMSVCLFFTFGILMSGEMLQNPSSAMLVTFNL